MYSTPKILFLKGIRISEINTFEDMVTTYYTRENKETNEIINYNEKNIINKHEKIKYGKISPYFNNLND